jgi:hypothetical protein
MQKRESHRCYFVGLGLLLLIPGAPAQQVTIKDHTIAFHGWLSQGFAYSSGNNYLTMDTTSGSLNLRDGGVNVSSQLTDGLRIGAQVSAYQVGALGGAHPRLDWAIVDYRAKRWLGVRVGQVKTKLGLHSDSQDLESLQTFAMPPSAMYPMDTKASTLAHRGADLYGEFAPGRVGRIAYTVYVGKYVEDPHDGNHFASDAPVSMSGTQRGADLRWYTPVRGLMIGTSYQVMNWTFKAQYPGANGEWSTYVDPKAHKTAFYLQYATGKWRWEAEVRRGVDVERTAYSSTASPMWVDDTAEDYSEWGAYGAVTYQATKRVTLGAYMSSYRSDCSYGSADNLLRDRAVTARYDLNQHFYFKAEGHFFAGYGNEWTLHGFYDQSNPNGLSPHTNLLVLRAGFQF